MGEVKKLKWWELYNNEQPKCPYCGESIDIPENDLYHLYDLEEDDSDTIDCPYCDEEFCVRTKHEITFTTRREEGDSEDEN